MTIVRRAVPADAAALGLVGAATFLDSYAGIIDGGDIVTHAAHQHAPCVYADWLTDPATIVLIAETPPGDAPVGYAVLTAPKLPIDPMPGDIEIRRIYLLSRFHGGGLGRAMMEQGADAARAAGHRRLLLGVYRHNNRAIAFYRKAGFAVIGRREFSVGARSYDDLVLARDL
jgi:ribosomal protein S18 acetylase RimI-like enzyme